MVTKEDQEYLIKEILSMMRDEGATKIKLIKTLRCLMKLSGGLTGLKDCKDAIELLYPEFQLIGFSREVEDELKMLYRIGHRIKMIKLISRESHMGLKEAKDYVNRNWRWS